MLGKRGHIVGSGAPRQKTGVDSWMEGLNPPVHHLGVPCHLRYISHLYARLTDCAGCAPGRQDFPTGVHQRFREILDARLVRHAQKRTSLHISSISLWS